jgi:hypothetical protein
MEIQPDFKELLALFNANDVEYLIVGGYALAYHGAPRYTGDLDLLVRPEADNADRIVAALAQFGFGTLDLSASDFVVPDQVVQLGVPPVRIDILTSLSGVSWEEAWASRQPGFYGDLDVGFIGREAFIANKRAAGRQRDLADIEDLEGT